MPTEDQSSSIKGNKYIDSRCIVHFRPIYKWHGRHGFDWFRIGDTEETINEQIYNPDYEKDGFYQGIGNQYIRGNGGKVISLENNIAYLNSEYGNKIIIQQKEQKTYHVPWISTFNYDDIEKKYSCKICINLKIHAENVKIIRIYRSEGLREKEIKVISKNGDFTDQIVIEQRNNHAIKLTGKAEFNDGSNSFVGQAIIVGYIPKRMNICFIPIITSFADNATERSEIEKKIDEQKKIILPKLLSQPQIVPYFETKNIDSFGKETQDKINEIIEEYKPYKIYYDQYGNQKKKYDVDYRGYYMTLDNDNGDLVERLYSTVKRFLPNKYVVFLINQRGKPTPKSNEIRGRCIDIPTLNKGNFKKCKAVVVFNTLKSETVCHELLHCLGLFHTFSSYSRHIFEKGKTNNIMDYSSSRQSLWKWQWDIIRDAHGIEKIYNNE